MPEEYNGSFEKSAYGCYGMEPEDIWKLNELEKEPKGRASYQLTALEDLGGLSFLPDALPSLHGNLVGWAEGKDARMEAAKGLAEKSAFITYAD